MSDENEKDKGKADRPPTIPPDLAPFMGKRQWEKAEIRDSGEVRAAFADVDALIDRLKKAEEEADRGRGVGNSQMYVGPVEVPEAMTPQRADENSKVALHIADVPRALPAGVPTNPTVEVRARLATQHQSPWAIDVAASIDPTDVPSTHLLADQKRDAKRVVLPRDATAAKRRWKWELALAGALLAMGVLVFAFAATTSSHGELPTTSTTREVKEGLPSGSPASAEVELRMDTAVATAVIAVPKSASPDAVASARASNPRQPVHTRPQDGNDIVPGIIPPRTLSEPPLDTPSEPVHPRASKPVPSSVPQQTGPTDIF